MVAEGTSERGEKSRGETTLALLAEIARVATEGLELGRMLQRITDTLLASLDWDHVGFARVDREHGVFVCEAVSSRLPTDIAVGYRRALGSGVVGQVATTGQPIVVTDVTEFPGYVAAAEGVRCEVCLPIVHGGEVVAILNFEDTRPRALETELPLLDAVARQIAGAIANARLHEEVWRRAQQLQLVSDLARKALEAEELEPVLTGVIERLRERFDFLLACVYLIDHRSSRLELQAIATRRPLDGEAPRTLSSNRGILGRAVNLRRAQLVLDVRSDPDYLQMFADVTAELAIPILFQGRTLGAFDFENDRAQSFSEEAVALIQMVTDQIAGVVHLAAVNRRLSELADELANANRRLHEMNRTLEELSTVDALTGLPNRRQFDRTLDLEWRRAIRGGNPLSLLFIDIDFFKRYNDTHGHLRGDAVLAEVAALLGAAFTRAGDLVARYGGEEFAALLPNTTIEAAMELAEQARVRIESRAIAHPASDAARVVTVSLGVATTVPDAWRLPSAIIERADRALYLAKASGRNCSRISG
jgi:diguanylate cyclase (GGDEF)-like protein